MTNLKNSNKIQPNPDEDAANQYGADLKISKFELLKAFTDELSQKNIQIPPCPESALRIKNAVENASANANQLADIVKTEPLLVARIFGYANSAFSRGQAGEISNLGTAIARIGANTVKNISLALATESAFEQPQNSKLKGLVARYRTESVVVSLFCTELARRSSVDDVTPDDAMLAGLLHAIGKFYLIAQHGRFPELFESADELEQLIEEWHTGIGASILEYWQLSPEAVRAVDTYTTPAINPSEPDDATILRVAYLLSKDFIDSEAVWEHHCENPQLCALNINEKQFQEIVAKVNELAPPMISAMGC